MAFPWMAVAQLGIGAIQSAVSSSNASNLPVPKQYTVSPEMRLAYNMARTRADEGYSAEEKSAFQQMLARQGTAAKAMFRNVGLAGAGSAAANIMGIDALNQFSAQGANIRRQNFGQFASMAEGIQGVQDRETTRFNEQLRAEEQALGGATQAGIGNMFGALNSGMNFMQNEQAINAYQGVGGSNSAGGGPSFKPAGTPPQTTSFQDPSFNFSPMQTPQMNNWGGFGNGMMQPQQPQPNSYGFQPYQNFNFAPTPGQGYSTYPDSNR